MGIFQGGAAKAQGRVNTPLFATNGTLSYYQIINLQTIVMWMNSVISTCYHLLQRSYRDWTGNFKIMSSCLIASWSGSVDSPPKSLMFGGGTYCGMKSTRHLPCQLSKTMGGVLYRHYPLFPSRFDGWVHAESFVEKLPTGALPLDPGILWQGDIVFTQQVCSNN